MTIADEYLTMGQVAAMLKLSRPRLLKWCNDQVLPAVKIGKGWRIRRSELDAWYESRRVAPQPEAKA